MYYPGSAGYDANGQWQQPPPPAAGPPPPPPPMSAEAAAAYKNYGYGNVAPRSGPHGARGPMPPPGQQSMAHQPPGGQYPPAKRAKYDRNMAHPHAGTPPYQGQPYQPVMYQAPPLSGQPQYQAMPPTGQPYYPPPQIGHPGYPPANAGHPQHPYQYAAQVHQPMVQPRHQPPQPYPTQDPTASAPPLAVALMKATPMASASWSGEKSKLNTQPHYNANLPPPPPFASAPPPPPSSEPPGIPSGPKGLASLPVRPATAAAPPNPASPSSSTTAMPSTSGIPTGPSANRPAIKRDTRPLPPQSRHVKDSLRGSEGSSRGGHSGENRGKGPPTGPARGGRGGRGGGRSGFDGSRSSNRQQHSQNSQNRRDDRFGDAQQNKEKGYKRTFSQTGPPPNSPRGPATRPRRNSDTASTSGNVPTGPKKGQASHAKKRERTMEGSPAPSVANQKSLKRTLTDFRIESLEIPILNWVWKAVPLSQILAQMNLKEKEETSVKKEEGTENTAEESTPIVEAKDEAETHQFGEPGALVKDTAGVSESDMAKSAELQRSDSRPEKRKHARDEDDEDQEAAESQREVASEEAKDHIAYPIGKKVKSGKVTELNTNAAKVIDVPTLPLEADDDGPDSDRRHAHVEKQPIVEVTGVAAIDSPLQPTEDAKPDHDDGPDDDDSETSNSSDEVADSIIAARAHGETHEVRGTPAPKLDGSETLDVEDPNTEIVSSTSTTKAAEMVKVEPSAMKRVPKKFWENSRLRIYFMSPIELEQKDVRQGLVQQKRKAIDSVKSAANIADVGVEEQGQEGSTNAIVDKTQDDASQAEVAQDAQSAGIRTDDVNEDSKTEGGDDLDGEPLSLEEQAALSTAKSAVEVEKTSEVVKAQTSTPPEDTSAEETKEDDHLKASQDDSADGAPGKRCHPSADRLSVAYAQNTRRLVVDAEVVEEVVVHRAEGRIEISFRIEKPTTDEEGKGFRCAKGVYIEKSTSTSDQAFEEISISELTHCWTTVDETRSAGLAHGETSSSNQISPPFHLLVMNPETSDTDVGEDAIQRCTIIARMDRAHPLTEAKWVRTGNADEWIQSVIGSSHLSGKINNNDKNTINKHNNEIPGGTISQQLHKGKQGKQNNDSPIVSGNAKNSFHDKDMVRGGSAWKGKIRVVDPDAPPTFQHALENWLSAANSRYGFDEARYKFVNTHFQDVNNVLEVLLRLIRGSSNSSGGAGGGGGNPSSSGSFASLSHSSDSNTPFTSLASQSKALQVPYPEYQTPISLASFQIFRLAIEASSSSLSSNISKENVGLAKKNQQQQHQQQDMERTIGEIIRNLPYNLIFKSLDSMFTDYKKGNLG